jgi:dihydrofolate reductase
MTIESNRQSTSLPLVIVAAVARNGIIGGDNRLLWSLRSDLRRFRALTMGKPMLMGRRTYESIGKPLPGRETVIITRSRPSVPEGVHVVGDLEAALALGQARARAMGADAVIVAGGGEIYRELMPRCDKLHITEVDLTPAGDTYFPSIDSAMWVEVSRDVHAPGEGDDAGFAFVDYERRNKQPSVG